MLSKSNSKVRAVSVTTITIISCILGWHSSYSIDPHVIWVYSNVIRLGNRRNVLILCLWNDIGLNCLPILKGKIAFVLWLYGLLNVTCSLASMRRGDIAILRNGADIAVCLRDVGGYTVSILPCINATFV